MILLSRLDDECTIRAELIPVDRNQTFKENKEEVKLENAIITENHQISLI